MRDAPGDGGVDACVPGPDEPDPMFIDSNCDGVDGDVSRSVFVAASASPGGDGSMSRPFASIVDAISAAATDGRDVLVATGTYDQTITLADGVDVFGGYDPSTWTRSSARPVVRGVAGSVAVSAADIDMPTRVAGIAFQGADAVEAGRSSVAGRLVRVTALTLEDCTFTGGRGAAGLDQVTPAATMRGATGVRGGAGAFSGVTGLCPAVRPPEPAIGVGAEAMCGCGAGGSGGVVDGYYGPGGARRPAGMGNRARTRIDCGFLTTPTGMLGGAAGAAGAPGRRGMDGATGATGTAATAAAATIGLFSETGYAPADGASGAAGRPGDGGSGGGGGATCSNDADAFCLSTGGAGGGGGSGGCGGDAGAGGGGGGASVGLLLWESSPTLIRVTISAGNGGSGGEGANGGSGGAGGLGGDGGARGRACTFPGGGTNSDGGRGGDGGAGGTGGAGSGGTGGPSIGIVLGAGSMQGSGSTGVTITTATGGAPGSGGTGAVSGASGLVQPTYTPP